MSENEKNDQSVIGAWLQNAEPWTDAVRGKTIESRKLATDEAVLSAVMSCDPKSVLDIGCGEGWLSRALAERGIKVTGVDVVPELIEKAKAGGGGDFSVASYEDIAGGALSVKVDTAVANFSLIGAEAVDALIEKVPDLLNEEGSLVIQTPHPVVAGGDEPYVDGWREGSWAGCGPNFRQAAPWYFRTIGTWLGLLRRSGFEVRDIREPVHPVTGKPASLVLIAVMTRSCPP